MHIEKNEPIPDGNVTAKRYPFRGMEVGDSIFLPVPDGEAMWGAARVFQHRNTGYRFTARKVQKDGVIGYRVWRTA